MRAATIEWMAKADADINVAKRESRVKKLSNFDAVCFHCQQCAEKYLKAYLEEHARIFPKTHNLTVLAREREEVDPTFLLDGEMLRRLTEYAVKFRYPGENAIRAEAKEALKFASEVRTYIRQKLGISD